MPSAVLIEDEALPRAQLRELLAQLWPECTLLGEAADVPQAVQLLANTRPDVAFIDIRLPGAVGEPHLSSGLDLAALASRQAHIVFVTAYDEHAVAAFRHGAADYLLKPIDAARLAITVERLKQRCLTAPQPLTINPTIAPPNTPQKHAYLKWLQVGSGQQLRLLTLGEVLYFQSDTKYTRVITQDAEHFIRLSVRELAESLDPDQFWQIHRSTVVNLNAIASVHRDLAGRTEVLLRSKPERLAVSQSFAGRFKLM
jgi:DNA-binding LytR/AlgR family response regulator